MADVAGTAGEQIVVAGKLAAVVRRTGLRLVH